MIGRSVLNIIVFVEIFMVKFVFISLIYSFFFFLEVSWIISIIYSVMILLFLILYNILFRINILNVGVIEIIIVLMVNYVEYMSIIILGENIMDR